MGTRHLIVVVLNKKVKVAQYGQWDGYPSGQGETIVKFLRSKKRLQDLKRNLKSVKFINREKINNKWIECGADPNSDSVTFEISDLFYIKYPELSRDTGADILNCIVNGATELKNELKFASDSLMCEYAYVLDLDKNVLEVYKGFNKDKPKGRFAKMKVEDKYAIRNNYKPVTLFKKLKFSELKFDTMIKLEKEMYVEDEV